MMELSAAISNQRVLTDRREFNWRLSFVAKHRQIYDMSVLIAYRHTLLFKSPPLLLSLS